MSNSWIGDVDETEDDSEEVDFIDTLERFAEDEIDIDEVLVVRHLDDVDDVDLLKDAWLMANQKNESELTNLFAKRLEAKGEEVVASGEPEPAVESLDEMEDESPSETDEIAPEAAEMSREQSEGPPLSQNALSPEEAAEGDQRWKMLIFGPPKTFKTHYCFTMPEPVAFIDLEGKADDISAKFAGKEIRIWQPKNMNADPDTKFRRAKIALDEALEYLDWYREHEGRVGSICVDSISLLWEWAQMHHKIENYPLKDPDEVELSANFGSSQESDWAVVKEYHNREFRERITDSPYHFCWTAMEREAYREALENEESRRVMEPVGEPKNDYKADTVIRSRTDRDKGKVGDLTGSNLTDNVFVGLVRPTFEKVENAMVKLMEAEASDEPVSRKELAEEIGVEAIIDYDPQVYNS